MTDGSLAVIVVDYFAGQTLRRCVDGVLNQPGLQIDVTVVDSSGQGVSEAALGSLISRVNLIASARNVGFAAAANHGLASTRGRWVGFVNPDAVLPAGAAEQLLEFLESHPEHAAVGPALRGHDGTPQPFSHGSEPTPSYLARRALNRLANRPLHDWGVGAPRDVDWVSGACLFARREAFERVGGFDERFFMYFEDVDWCRRCRQAGWRLGFVASTSVEHQSTANDGDPIRRRYYRESLRRYYGKHYGQAAGHAVWVLQGLAGR
jgi:N-acetylglucosaminyl-diphospho-decaprenol L-rhamnosyltransferase